MRDTFANVTGTTPILDMTMMADLSWLLLGDVGKAEERDVHRRQ